MTVKVAAKIITGIMLATGISNIEISVKGNIIMRNSPPLLTGGKKVIIKAITT